MLGLCTIALAPAFAEEAVEPAAESRQDSSGKSRFESLLSAPKLQVKARLHTLWTVEDDSDKPANDFSIDLARLEFVWEQGKIVEGALQFDVAAFRADAASWGLLRDAYIRIAPLKALKLTMGQFKRPFSMFELRSRGKIEVIDRGIGNEWLIEDLGYGDRDIGVQRDGKLFGKRGLYYALGVFNGQGRNTPDADLDGSKDIVGRVEVDPLKWLTFGASGAWRKFSSAQNALEIPPLVDSAWAAGADVALDFDDVRCWTEGTVGQRWDIDGVPYAWTGLVMALYTIDLVPSWSLRLQPVGKAEVVVPDSDEADARIWMFTPGVNLLFGNYVRLMIDGEFRLTGSNQPLNFKGTSEVDDEMKLMVQLALDI